MAQKWDKVAGEDEADFALFLRFRDLGLGRSLPKLRAEVGQNLSMRRCQRLSAKFEWHARADAWDLHQAQNRSAESQAAIDGVLAYLESEAMGFARYLAQVVHDDGSPPGVRLKAAVDGLTRIAAMRTGKAAAAAAALAVESGPAAVEEDPEAVLRRIWGDH